MSDKNLDALINDFYTPIDFAISELQNRSKLNSLSSKIFAETKLTKNLSVLLKKNHLVYFRQLATPLNELIRIYSIAKEKGLDLLIIEFLDDKFTPSVNVYKHNLGKLPIYNGSDINNSDIIYNLNLVDFPKMEGRVLGQVYTHKKDLLSDIHHELLVNILNINLEKNVIDGSDWFLKFKGAKEYYREFFKLFLINNILAEVYLTSGNEMNFTKEIILPILNEIKDDYKFKPLIWNYLEDDAGKYFWDCYPKQVGVLLKQKGYN